jgi:actin-related protein 5
MTQGSKDLPRFVLAYSLLHASSPHIFQNVFITGGPSQLPGLSDRLYSTLRPILSPETNLRITTAANPTLDPWKGMSRFAGSGQLAQVSVTRAEYDEWGGERVKRWWGGNWNMSGSL